MIENFDDYKFRCSQLGKLMVNSKKKNDPLSQTTKTYLDTILKEELFGIKTHGSSGITSKYLEKGIVMEDAAIEMVAKYENKKYKKNTKRFYNEFVQGEPDIIADDEIIDIKCSWSYATFPLTRENIPSNDYYYQLMGYMYLTSKKKSRLLYCLMDTPTPLIDAEIRTKTRDAGLEKPTEDLVEAIISQMTYPEVDVKYKMKAFDIEYDPEVILEIILKITECRKYLNRQLKDITDE